MITVDEDLCVGCAMCVPACPEDAISCFGAAEINEQCTECLMCLASCPVLALRKPVKEVATHG
jgi:ferredoxin